MKTVVSSDMVCHLWANQTQEYARNSQGNVSFSHGELSSYRTVIAKHVSHRGKKAVLITTRHYSNTTCKHVSRAWRAANHLVVFRVHNIDGNPLELFGAYNEQLIELVGKLSRARTNKDYYVIWIGELVAEANSFAEFYGLRHRLHNPENLNGLIEYGKKIKKANRDRISRLARAKLRKRREQQEQWKAGIIHYYPHGQLDEPVYLRVQGNELQTSLGATTPLDHAIKAFSFIKQCHDKQTEWVPNGHSIRLGQFAIDKIEANGNVKAGCHYVQWEEIERIATLLNVA